MLGALANNRTFLADYLIDELVRPKEASAGILNTSIKLFSGPRVIIRANFWYPLDEFPRSMVGYASQFAYLSPHDHTFDFLTVGYLGPGYLTSIFERPVEPRYLSPGQSVPLAHLEDTSLPKGKMMIYLNSRESTPSKARSYRRASNGYEPMNVAVPANRKITLAFLRSGEPNCGTKVVFPELGLTKEIPLGGMALVEIPPSPSGELRFTCGMGMYRGRLVISR